jgi:hypothetical protein
MTSRDDDLAMPAIGPAKPNLLFALLIRFLAVARRRPSCNPVDMLDERGLKDIGLDAQSAARIVAANREAAFRLLMGRGGL